MLNSIDQNNNVILGIDVAKYKLDIAILPEKKHYVIENDKKAIFAYQNPDDYLFLKQDGNQVDDFAKQTKAQVKYFSVDSIISSFLRS